MKIYFSGSIRGGRQDARIYGELLKILQQFGDVLTPIIGDVELDETDEAGVSDEVIWNRDVNWVEEADILVAETTQTSLGVGYEIAWAHLHKVPVLALYRQQPGKRLSAMVGGDPNVSVCQYSEPSGVYRYIAEFVEKNHLK